VENWDRPLNKVTNPPDLRHVHQLSYLFLEVKRPTYESNQPFASRSEIPNAYSSTSFPPIPLHVFVLKDRRFFCELYVSLRCNIMLGITLITAHCSEIKVARVFSFE
jgi:hypothetical protein